MNAPLLAPLQSASVYDIEGSFNPPTLLQWANSLKVVHQLIANDHKKILFVGVIQHTLDISK